MLKILSLAACLAVTATPALAQADTSEAPTKKDKLVCKRVQGTGWRLSSSTKVCKTRAEWTAISEETQKEYRDYGRSASQGDANGE